MTQAHDIIRQVMQEVQGVAKNDKNTAQGFNFRGIDAVINKVGPALRKAGGFIVPRVIDKTAEVMPSARGGSLNVVRLTVEYAIYGSEGEPLVGTVVSEAFDSGDKATAKAMSVAFRTFLLQTLALPTDEPDPDHDSYEIGQTAAPAKATPPAASAPQKAFHERIAALTTVEDARALYSEAQRAKVGREILDAIQSKAETLG
jgi:hypothetical protein